MAMPPVAGFLEMFAGVLYNIEKNETLIFTHIVLNGKKITYNIFNVWPISLNMLII